MITLKRESEKRKIKKMLIAHYNPKSKIAEQYRIIRTNIQFASVEREIRSLVVTSATSGTGNTTTMANLGVVIAQQSKKVLLIDTNFRKPSLHNLFKNENKVGLTNVLMNTYSIHEAIIKTPIKNLDLLTCGSIPSNPSELLSLKKMEQVIYELQKLYDFLLFDSPSILDYSDTQILANLCDGSLLVLKSGESKKEEAALATSSLLHCKAKLVGAVLNQKK